MGVEWSTVYYIAATLALAGSVAITMVTLRLRKEFASQSDLDKIEARVNRHNDRIVLLESLIQHLPDKDGLNGLAVAMKGLGGEIQVAAANISAVTRDLSRIEATITRHEDILSQAARSLR